MHVPKRRGGWIRPETGFWACLLHELPAWHWTYFLWVPLSPSVSLRMLNLWGSFKLWTSGILTFGLPQACPFERDLQPSVMLLLLFHRGGGGSWTFQKAAAIPGGGGGNGEDLCCPHWSDVCLHLESVPTVILWCLFELCCCSGTHYCPPFPTGSHSPPSFGSF